MIDDNCEEDSIDYIWWCPNCGEPEDACLCRYYEDEDEDYD